MTILKIADLNNKEMEAYENEKGLFYISICTAYEDRFRDQFITIDPIDAQKLVDELSLYIERNG